MKGAKGTDTDTEGTTPWCTTWKCVTIFLIVVAMIFNILNIAYHLYEPPKYEYDNKVEGNCSIRYTDRIHCGLCGKCSTEQDYNVYYDKRETLTGIAKACAIRDVFAGREDSIKCFDENAGLTPDCRDCWLLNIDCDREHCFFPCLWEAMLGIEQNRDADTLSKCFACDEYYCLDIFIDCAGMSRRRAGITTDIDRHPTEMCL